MTAPATPTTFAHLALDLITPSPTNPRKHFDHDKLVELAKSIEAGGVHTPVLVRPLPAHRLEDTAHLRPRPTHELVAGERRLRASELARTATIPAMVRALTDAQVLEIQIVENLQRDDLTELEEAEGYEALIDASGMTAEGVGAKIGKSRSYVYGRLKLLALGQEGRQALREGWLPASHALLLARIPNTKVQAQALNNLRDYGGTVLSLRSAQDLLQRHYMLRLERAPFLLTDATLVPEAGSCTQCPKRTGADPDLFADVKGADLCLDFDCHRAKEQAHQDAIKRQAHERGLEVIDGRAAKALSLSQTDGRLDGYKRLDDAQDSPTARPLRAILGELMQERGIKEVLIANPRKEGELMACLPTEVVTELLAALASKDADAAQAAEQIASDEAMRADWDAKRATAEAKQEFESTWRWDMLVTTWGHIRAGTAQPWDSLLRHIAMGYAQPLNQEQCKRLCKLLELGKVAPKEGLLEWVQDVPDPHLALQLLVMFRDVEYRSWIAKPDEGNAGLLLVAKEYGVTVEDMKSQVKKAIRAATKALETVKKAAATPSADSPAAQARGVRGESQSETKRGRNPGKRKSPKDAPATPTMSAEEAMQGIAAAMQSQEAGGDCAPGEPVGGAAADGLEDRPAADGAGAAEESAPLQPGDRVRVVGPAGFMGGRHGTVSKVNIKHDMGDVFVSLDDLSAEYAMFSHELERLPETEDV